MRYVKNQIMLLIAIVVSSIFVFESSSLGQQRPTTPAPRAVQQQPTSYLLGAGDRLRVVVFGEEDLSGEFEVDGNGMVSMKLIGRVRAGGQTANQFEDAVTVLLKDGYVRDPRVSVEVLNYRPFYILGEVEKRGSYPYVNGMNVANAVALAGGYTYRAAKNRITVQRFNDPEKKEQVAEEETPVLPGDIVRIPERFF